MKNNRPSKTTLWKNSWNGVHVWQRKIAEPFLIFGAVPKHIIIRQAQSEPSWQISWQFCGDGDNNYLTGNPSSNVGILKPFFNTALGNIIFVQHRTAPRHIFLSIKWLSHLYRLARHRPLAVGWAELQFSNWSQKWLCKNSPKQLSEVFHGNYRSL